MYSIAYTGTYMRVCDYIYADTNIRGIRAYYAKRCSAARPGSEQGTTQNWAHIFRRNDLIIKPIILCLEI